tara:strand:+ start:729 stop:1415 length:687 start_codon:yes stop_codon:yes gene_type:complete
MANYEKGTNGIDGPLSGSLSNPNNGSQVGSYINHLYYAVDGGVWNWDGTIWIFRTSLKGNVGARGHFGEQGPIGVQGTSGLRGLFGPIGDRGFQGSQGLRGIPGASGVSLSIPMILIPRNSSFSNHSIDDTYIVIDSNLARYNIAGIHASYGSISSDTSITYKLIQTSLNGEELGNIQYEHPIDTKYTKHNLNKSISLNEGDTIYLISDTKQSSARGYSITIQLRQKS